MAKLFHVFTGWIWLFMAACTAGCATFRVPPYAEVVRQTDERTQAVQQAGFVTPVNRAALARDLSQAEIKPQLESLWRPSRRLSAIVNYNGLVATRQSQLNTMPGPMFTPGELTVQFLGRPMQVSYIAAFHRGKKLPVVVGISGINGSVDGKVTVDVLQSLYDSGEFHVVHLESLTSVNQAVRNQRPFMGGFPEGVLLYKTVAELRQSPEFADEIEQVHMLGVSFGGMLCGFAGYCESVFQQGVIDGAVLALSPPLDLQILFENLLSVRLIHDRVHRNYLEDGMKQYVEQTDLGLTKGDVANLNFDLYMRKIALPSVQKNQKLLEAEFPEFPRVETPEDIYALSSLRPLVGKLGVPFFYVYAYDDPVLSPEDHFRHVLLTCRNPLVDGMLLEDGGHLGYDAVCNFPFSGQVATRYFRYWSQSGAVASSPAKNETP